MSNAKNYIKYLTKRANNGDLEAQYKLGLEYISGISVKKDLALAEKWLKESAKNGYLYAEAAIGVMYMNIGNYEKAFNILLNVAQKGNMNAQSNLALFYLRGVPSIGISQDLEKAAYWLELAAAQGEVVAMYNLGNLLLKASGAQKDIARGLELLEETANTGYPPAQAGLGLEYFTGDNTSKDFKKASEWMSKALNNGYLSTAVFLAYIFEEGGYGIKQNYQKAYDYCKQAYSYYEKPHEPAEDTREVVLLINDSNAKNKELVFGKRAIRERMERLQAILNSQK